MKPKLHKTHKGMVSEEDIIKEFLPKEKNLVVSKSELNEAECDLISQHHNLVFNSWDSDWPTKIDWEKIEETSSYPYGNNYMHKHQGVAGLTGPIGTAGINGTSGITGVTGMAGTDPRVELRQAIRKCLEKNISMDNITEIINLELIKSVREE
jgi:hypothetical protein